MSDLVLAAVFGVVGVCLGAAITGAFAYITTWQANKYALQKQKKQFAADRESLARKQEHAHSLALLERKITAYSDFFRECSTLPLLEHNSPFLFPLTSEHRKIIDGNIRRTSDHFSLISFYAEDHVVKCANDMYLAYVHAAERTDEDSFFAALERENFSRLVKNFRNAVREDILASSKTLRDDEKQ